MRGWVLAVVIGSRFVALALGATARLFGMLPIIWDAPPLEERMRAVQSLPRLWCCAWAAVCVSVFGVLTLLVTLAGRLAPPFDRLLIAVASVAAAVEIGGHALQVVLPGIAEPRLYLLVETVGYRLSGGAAHLGYAIAIALSVAAFATRRRRILAACCAWFAALTGAVGLLASVRSIEMGYGPMGWIWCGLALLAARSPDAER